MFELALPSFRRLYASLFCSLTAAAGLALLAAPAAAAQGLAAAPALRAASIAASTAASARLAAAAPVRISRQRATGMVRFATFPAGRSLAVAGASSPRAAAGAFLADYGAMFGAGDPDRDLTVLREGTDSLGVTHVVYGQLYQGLEVFAARLVVHVEGSSRIRAANGVLVPAIAVDPSPGISKAAAASSARAAARAWLGMTPAKPLTASVGALKIFREGLLQGVEGSDHLVYEVEVRDDAGLRELFYVDAHSGKVVDRIDGNQDLSRRIYQGSYKASNVIWNEGDTAPTGDHDVDTILDGSAAIYALFGHLSDESYISYDGMDHVMEAVTDLTDNPSSPTCPNAFWDGRNTNFCAGVPADDVVAHEWTHAYTEKTDGLIYQWQSGALNESFSDIFGETVDLTDGIGTDDPNLVRSEGACSSHSNNVAGWQVVVNSPPSAVASYAAGSATFGPLAAGAGISGDLVLADDGNALDDPDGGTGSTSDACQTLLAPATGHIVIADRGGCSFVQKTLNTQAAGAIGLVVVNNLGNEVITMGGSDNTITIPALFLGQSDGAAIKAALPGPVNVTMGSLTVSEEDSWRWLVSEDSSSFGGPIRDMWLPECRNDPGRVGDAAHYVCDTADSGGVHSNSGVPNHAYALIVDGGSYNGRTLHGIGLTKAAHVYWRAMTVYQVPATDFADHADAVEQACADLVGAALSDPVTGAPSGQSISGDDCDQISIAMDAVEMRDTPAQCGFVALLDPAAPPLCDGGAVTSFFDENFETDPAGAWTFEDHGVFSAYTPRSWQWKTALPKGRAGHALFAADDPRVGSCAGSDTDQSGVVYATSPQILLPQSSGPPRLSFTHYVATEAYFDGGVVEISVNGGEFTPLADGDFTFNSYPAALTPASFPNHNPLAGDKAFSGSDQGTVSGTWVQSQADLGWYARPGDSVRLRFSFGTDGCGGVVGWYIDDVSVYGCVEPAAGLDPFLCYADRLEPGTPALTPVTGLSVLTQFDAGGLTPEYDVVAQRSLCNPATLESVAPFDPTTHLSAYELDLAHNTEGEASIAQVDTRFGRLWLATRGSSGLMVAAATDASGPASAPDPGSHLLDAYKCYQVKRAAHTPKLRKGLQATVLDEFAQPAAYDLRAPSRLCVAASVDGAAVKNEAAWGHLLCYRARRSRDAPSFESVSGLSSADMFADLSVNVVRPGELCVPATVADLAALNH